MPEPPLPEESLFAQALDIVSATERAAFLDRACGHDPALRAAVEALLHAHARSGDLLDLPENGPPTTDQPAGEGPGSRLGRYKLLEQIGEGGMGAVWMADQTEPVQRRVALKVIKEGMDSKQVLARFEAERQALALMDHPNIARVLDGGQTPSGRPFFVMELVKGQPITKYCDDKQLSVRERLTLFGDVCRAVQHAHQKGIIHRDLKPSNVLVAPYDGRPVVKVIDFGVAKATGQCLTDKTLFTGFGALVGTPEYMSPEQAEVNNQDIDTRSDVYSLGVLLYELLTGSTPLTRQRVKEAALLEVLRVIREEEPPRPSTRLSQSTASLPAISAQRQTEPAKLTRLVRGELDWIAMKALDKDRGRRYETATGLARDVERYLADEPVLACPPSAAYRIKKFAWRHKTGLAVAGLILFFLAALGSVVGWVMRERAARLARATNDLELALDRADLFQGQGKWAEALAAFDRARLLAEQAPPDPDRGERLAALKERLDAEARDQEFVARFEQIRLQNQSRVNVQGNRFARVDGAAFAEIRDALGRYGIAVGAMEPGQVAALLQDRPEQVRRNLLAALDECLLAPTQDAPTRQWLLAALKAADKDAWRVRARQAAADRDWKELEELSRVAEVAEQPPSFLVLVAAKLPALRQATRLALFRRIQSAYPADLWANLELAVELSENHQPAEAVRYYTAGLALRPKNPGIHLNRGNALLAAGEVDEAARDFRNALALAPRYGAAHQSLGHVFSARGQVDRAVDEYRLALGIQKDSAETHTDLGTALYELGRLDDALAEYQEAVRLKDRLAEAHYGLGLALLDKGQVDRAVAEYRKALEIRKDYAEPHVGFGHALFTGGQVGDAIKEYRQALDINPDSASAHYGHGNALESLKKVDDAIAEYRAAIRLKKGFALAQNRLGIALRSQGRVDEAVAAYRAALKIKANYPEAHNNLGNALLSQGKGDEAVAAYRAALRYRKDYAQAHYGLGQALARQGEFRQAVPELRRGYELGSQRPGWPDPTGQAVRQCERLIELDERLPGILEGKTPPAGAGERIELAVLCSFKRRHRAAAHFYKDAFTAQPGLETGRGTGHRYNAACAAALAGFGQGQDADKTGAAERAEWRRQSLDWLRADLEAWGRLLDGESDQGLPVLVQQMRHWLADADLAGVRGPQALARLPRAERALWRKFWEDVAATRARAQVRMTPEKEAAAK
jgi:tetratricopeptide (TPR) repeat protein